MLSFHIINSGRIQIHCDDEGMTTLIGALEKIRPDGGHVHLRTPSNGGRELDEEDGRGRKGVGEVIITWVGD